MGLLDRISAARTVEKRNSIDSWISDYLLPAYGTFGFGGSQYPFGLNTTYSRLAINEISAGLPGYMAAVRNCPPAFGAQLVRAMVLSQARFTFRNPPSSARSPRRTFGTSALSLLEKPWTNATTGELLSRMEWHAGLAGNAYVTNRTPGRLRVLRPDWVAIVYGSQQEPELAAHALDGELVGYVYAPGGLVNTGTALAASGGGRMYSLLPDEVAHWSPIPDPECAGIGMSWITPAVREIQGDIAASKHKLQFFERGATPNLVVKGIPAQSSAQFNELVEAMESRHAGLGNAYRTLYLTAGADATVVGSNLQQIDFKSTVGTGETRISVLSRVPAAVLGISEGLAGSSLNAGNFGQARRNFSDTWVFPSLQDLCAALAPLVRVPPDAELWFDTTDMPLLREDAKDAAEIEGMKADTITKYVREGFTADSAIAAVRGQDVSLLVHTNLVSVQLQQPGTTTPGSVAAPAARSRESDDDSEDEPDGDVLAILAGIEDFLDGEGRAAFNSALHPRNPKGGPGGGRFKSIAQRVSDALSGWAKGTGPTDPLDGFNREQLRKVAQARGIELKRGEKIEEIKRLLLEDIRGQKRVQREVTKAADANGFHANFNDPEVARLREGVRSGVKSEKGLFGGAIGDTRQVVFTDDSKAVKKISARDCWGHSGEDQAASEQLVSLLGRSFGAPVPPVYRHDAKTIYMGWVDGSLGHNLRGFDWGDNAADLVKSTDGAHRLGLLDILVNNMDRHGGNWLVDAKGSPVGIDHGLAFTGLRGGHVGDPPQFDHQGFSKTYIVRGKWIDNDLSPADVAYVREQISALRPDFAKVGKEKWLDFAEARLDAIAPYAKGEYNRIAAGGPHRPPPPPPPPRRGFEAASPETFRIVDGILRLPALRRGPALDKQKPEVLQQIPAVLGRKLWNNLGGQTGIEKMSHADLLAALKAKIAPAAKDVAEEINRKIIGRNRAWDGPKIFLADQPVAVLREVARLHAGPGGALDALGGKAKVAKMPKPQLIRELVAWFGAHAG